MHEGTFVHRDRITNSLRDENYECRCRLALLKPTNIVDAEVGRPTRVAHFAHVKTVEPSECSAAELLVCGILRRTIPTVW